MTQTKYLPFLLTVALLASLAAGCTLSALQIDQAQSAWEAFTAVLGALLGVHIPSPSQSGGQSDSGGAGP